MAGKLPEQSKWVDNIYQIEKETPVLGGVGGPDNVQAEQLACRTLFLKDMIESLSDYREYTFYPSESDPDGTNAGISGTPTGQSFRVALFDTDGSSIIFKYYLNNAGTAKFINEQISARGMTALFTGVAIEIQRLFVTAHIFSKTLNDLDLVDQNISEQVQRTFVSLQVLTGAVSSLASVKHVTPDEIGGLYMANQLAALNLSSLAASIPPDNKLENLLLTSQMAKALFPLEGFDPGDSESRNEISPVVNDLYKLPAPSGVAVIRLSSPRGIPPNKAAGVYPGAVKINIDGQVLDVYCGIAVQGDTSAGFPKKNLTFSFCSDAALENAVDLQIGDSVAQDKWIYKANWIDCTHARQWASYDLWDQMVQSRTGWPRKEVDNGYLGLSGKEAVQTNAKGHPVSYPAVLVVNGDFYGIGSLAIGKKRPNYNMPKNVENKILISMETVTAWVRIDLMSDTSNQTQYEMKCPSKPTDVTRQALVDWDTFVNATPSVFNAAAETRLDKQNVIDFYLFVALIGATDLVMGDLCKNFQFLTWDGTRWYFLPYDLDTTYGLHFAGGSISYPPDQAPMSDETSYHNAFWPKVKACFLSDIKTRYAALRDSGIADVNNLSLLLERYQSVYGEDLYKADMDAWPMQPSLNVTSRVQILNWFSARLAYLDSYFDYSSDAQ